MSHTTLSRAERRAARRANPDHVGALKTFGWSSRGFSLAANFIVLGYFTLYATDTLGLPAGLVGTLLLASKIFDGFTDLVAGYVIDRTRTRWGRARPYEWAIVGLWVCNWLLFSVPELGTVGKAIWIFVAYTFANSIFATLCYANQTLYMARAFNSRTAYAKLNAAQGVIITVGAMILSAGLPMALAWAGKDAGRWSNLMLLLALPLMLIGLGRFFLVKEIYETESGDEKITWADIKSVLLGNRWIWFLAGLGLLSNIPINTGANGYYFRYIVGDLGSLSLIMLVGIVGLPAVLLIPWLMRRFTLSRIIMMGQVLVLLGSVVNFFAGANLGLLLLAGAIGGIGMLPISYMVGVMLIDAATFNEWAGHRRLESTISALNSFASKLGQGFALGFAGIFLGALGYDGTADTQPDSALFAIHALYTWIPGLVALALIVLLWFYRLDAMLPGIHADLEARAAAKALQDLDDPAATAAGPAPHAELEGSGSL